MTACDYWSELASAALDGALSRTERRDLAAHLAGCQHCRDQAASLALASGAVRRLPVHRIPPEVRADVLRRASAMSVKNPASSKWRKNPAAGSVHMNLPDRGGRWAAGIAAFVLAAALAGGRSYLTNRELSHALIADHREYLPKRDAPVLQTSDPSAVEHWFAGRLDFPLRAPELPACRLLGGRLCHIRGRTAALLFYDHQGQRISLFALADRWPHPGLGASEAGFHCRARSGAGVMYAMVAALPPGQELDLLSAAVRARPTGR